MTRRRTKRQLAAIEQADAILKTAEDAAIERINKAIDKSFAELTAQLRKKWPQYETGDTFATDRALLLVSELQAAIKILDPNSKRAKTLRKEFLALLKLSDKNGNELAGRLFDEYQDSRGLDVGATATASIDVLAEASQEAYDRLLKHGQKFAEESSIIIQQGIIQGWGSKKTATAIAARTGVLKWRAEMIARTETGKAQNRAAKRRYAAEDVDMVMWVATQDAKVCEFCAYRAGNIYKASEVDGVLHPNDRCYLNPVKQDWLEEGLIDLEWAEQHSKDAIAKLPAGKTPNRGLSPFERSAGLSNPPKPVWKPGVKVAVAQDKDREQAIKALAGGNFSGDPKVAAQFNDAIQVNPTEIFSDRPVIRNAKNLKFEQAVDTTGRFGFNNANVDYEFHDGKRKRIINWMLFKSGKVFHSDKDYSVNEEVLPSLKKLGWKGDVVTVNVTVDKNFSDTKKGTKTEKSRVAINLARAWKSMLQEIPEGTLLHNKPVGGAGGKRERFYNKNGFGKTSNAGQFGFVTIVNGRKIIVPVQLASPGDGKNDLSALFAQADEIMGLNNDN